MKQRWELERLEEERRQMAAFRRKAELGCVWGTSLFAGGQASCFHRLALGSLEPILSIY